MFPALFEASGIGYQELVEMLIQNGFGDQDLADTAAG
jgi:hypothetical protein